MNSKRYRRSILLVLFAFSLFFSATSVHGQACTLSGSWTGTYQNDMQTGGADGNGGGPVSATFTTDSQGGISGTVTATGQNPHTVGGSVVDDAGTLLFGPAMIKSAAGPITARASGAFTDATCNTVIGGFHIDRPDPNNPGQMQAVTGSFVIMRSSSCRTTHPPPPSTATNNTKNAWYQLDPNWAALPYDHLTGPVDSIGHWGCALLALNYALNAAGENLDPVSLNTLMDAFGDFSPPGRKPGSGGAVLFGQAVEDVAAGNLKFDVSKQDEDTTQALDSYLCSSNPRPVIVQVTNPTSGHQHYVVVTGKAGNDYSIVDPGYLNPPRTSLSFYGSDFTVTGVVTKPSGNDPSELDFSVVDSATLLVTAPDGTQTGLNPGTRQVLKGTVQAAYFAINNAVDTDVASDAPTSTTYYVEWLLPIDGSYAVQLNGLELGMYNLSIKAFDSNGKPESFVVLSGVANVGSTSSFHVQYVSTPGASLKVIRVATFDSTLADINNSSLLGLINNVGMATALTSKIRAAQFAVSSGQNQTAKNILQAFQNEVSAQTDKHITGVAPQVFQEDADSLISQLP
jgi:hypothetical protein